MFVLVLFRLDFKKKKCLFGDDSYALGGDARIMCCDEEVGAARFAHVDV